MPCGEEPVSLYQVAIHDTMSNSWGYNIFLPEKQEFSRQFLDQVLGLAVDLKYEPQYPVSVLTTDGMSDLRFRDVHALAPYVCSQGGSFPIWRGDDNLDLSFEPQKKKLEIFVTHDIQQGRDEQIAEDPEKLFRAYCVELESRYGYACDEWRLEAAFPGTRVLTAWQEFQDGINQGQPPSILFWLNYFDRQYWERIGPERLKDLECDSVQVAQGIFVYLARYPWDAWLAVLGKDGRYHLATT